MADELDKAFPVTGLAMRSEDPHRFMFNFPACCATRRCWNRTTAAAALK